VEERGGSERADDPAPGGSAQANRDERQASR